MQLTLSFELMKLLQFTFLLSVTIFDFLGFGQLESRSCSGINHLGRETRLFSQCLKMKMDDSSENKKTVPYMIPVLLWSMRQFLPAFYQQHTSVADVSNPILGQTMKKTLQYEWQKMYLRTEIIFKTSSIWLELHCLSSKTNPNGIPLFWKQSQWDHISWTN